MDLEIVIALVALGGTVFGSLVGAGVSIWINQKQLVLSLKQRKIEVIEMQITQLQSALKNMSEVPCDVKDSNLTQDQIHSRIVDAFLQRSNIFFSLSYMFPVSLTNQIKQINIEINQLIYAVKTFQPIDENRSRMILESIHPCSVKMTDLIHNRLRLLQSEIDALTLNSKKTI